MFMRYLKKELENIEQLYFEPLEENEFYIKENGEVIVFGQLKDGKKRFEFRITENKRMRILSIDNLIDNSKNEIKKYVVYNHLKNFFEEKKITGFLTTSTGCGKYFKNKKLKLTPLDEYSKSIYAEIERIMGNETRCLLEKRLDYFTIIKESDGLFDEYNIKYDDINKTEIIFIKNKKEVLYGKEKMHLKKMNKEIEKEIENSVKKKIEHNEIQINEIRMPILAVEKDKKNKIIIGKDVFDIEELNEIIKTIKMCRMSFYV